ncbi:SMR family transporter [Bacillus sp. JCM 19041]|uniref:DMT family transporter n=1 Tax=Bacillus sp. JCM 19041 TaxID=1460637 RepID=UPI0006D227B8
MYFIMLLILSTMIASVGDYYLKKSYGFSIFKPTVLAISTYLLALYLFAISLTELPLSIGYASWSGLGVIITGAIGYFLFKEKINRNMIISMGAIVSGIVLLNL